VATDEASEVGVFIAYAEQDLEAARKLKQRLTDWGYRAWLKEDELLPGMIERLSLEQAMARAAVALVCLSPDALRESGGHYRMIRWALDRQQETSEGAIFTIPVQLAPCETPRLFKDLVPAQLYRGESGYAKLRKTFERLSEKQKAAISLGVAAKHAQTTEGALAEAKELKKQQKRADQDTTETDARILELRRKLRDGPPPHEHLRLGKDGRFELFEQVGSGGFATVWRAYDRQEEELVAVKVLHGQHASSKSRRDRFRRGARKMKALQHDHIVRVVEPWVEENGYCFYAMEWMAGGDMRQTVLAGRLPVELVIPAILAVGRALQFAHEQQIVHRDVKPSNILLDADGRAKLTDFDLVQAHDTTGGTRTGAMGTFIYAAPEAMLDAKRVKPAVDVYGLAMSCIFGLYGEPLPPDVFRDVASFVEELPCSAKVKAVLAHGAAWVPSERPESAHAFVEALENAWRGQERPAAGSKSNETAPASAVKKPKREQPEAASLDAAAMVEAFEAEGRNWPVEKRLDWLERLGELGDPRLDPMRKDRWVYIEPGEFTMGDNRSQFSDEKPEHKVRIKHGYWLGRFPVTNDEFTQFIEAGGYREKAYWGKVGWDWRNEKEITEPSYWDDPQWNRPNQPVVGVSWHEAMAYCRWLEATLKAKRPEWAPQDFKIELPAEGQWEYAARGRESKIYPWRQDEKPNADLANSERNIGRTTPVGAYPRGTTPEGLLDMAGNVWEWQRDEWQENYKKCQGNDSCQHSDTSALNEASSASLRPLRGGAWIFVADSLRGSFRIGWDAWGRDGSVGFRCCLRSSSPEHG